MAGPRFLTDQPLAANGRPIDALANVALTQMVGLPRDPAWASGRALIRAEAAVLLPVY